MHIKLLFFLCTGFFIFSRKALCKPLPNNSLSIKLSYQKIKQQKEINVIAWYWATTHRDALKTPKKGRT